MNRIPLIEDLIKYSKILLTDTDFDKLFDDFVIVEPKCECGSDKVKSPIHSDWCPKYEEKPKKKKK